MEENTTCKTFKSDNDQWMDGMLYIQRNIYKLYALLCFVVVWYWSILPIYFTIASLALGQSFDCPSANEASLKDIGK